MNSKIISETNNNVNMKYDLAMFNASSSKGVARNATREGVMSIVNAKTGKRVVLSMELLKKVDGEEKVQVSLGNGMIAISNKIPNNNNYFIVKSGKSKGNIYSAGLVEELTNLYSLDFSNKTSMTFDDVDYIEGEYGVIAIIKIG